MIETIQTLALVTACIMGVFLVFLIVLAATVGLMSLYESKVATPNYERGAQAQYMKDRSRLVEHSYWFSEDLPTQRLIEDLARDGYDIGQIRDSWRARVKKQQAGKENV